MIEIAKLTSMLDAEIEMAAAWDSMSARERKAYVTAHPNSRFNSGTDKGSKSDLSGHFAKHGWTKYGTNTYTHKNGRKIIVKKSAKAGKKFHIEVHHKNGDVTSHHRNTANNIGALVRHWAKADKKGHYQPRAYKAGTIRKKAVAPAPIVKKGYRPTKTDKAILQTGMRPAKPMHKQTYHEKTKNTDMPTFKKRGRPPKAGNPQPIKSFKDLIKRHPEMKTVPSITQKKKMAASPKGYNDSAPVVKKIAKKIEAPVTKKPVRFARPIKKVNRTIKVAPVAPKAAKKPLMNHIKKAVDKHAKIAVEKHINKVAPKAMKPLMPKKASKEADWGDAPVAKKKAPLVKPMMKPAIKKTIMTPKVAKKPMLKKASKEADW